MKKSIIRLAGVVISLMMIFTSMPVFAFASSTGYADVPDDSWAVSAINQAKEFGLINGQDISHFGYGKAVTKAEFVTILCNMFKWEQISPETPSFPDVESGSWYYPYIETALAHNVMVQSQSFAPNSPISREEAAVMFVRALGLNEAAKLQENASLPFIDVKGNKGYIAVAHDIGMINGTSSTTFSPASTATREEVAAMLTRVYTKYYGQTDFLHGFYAISSYSQKELIRDMDAVTLVWSTMMLDGKGVWLNTGSENNNQYKIADSYADLITYLDTLAVKRHLGVYMDTSKGAAVLLTNPSNRAAAVEAIMAELTRVYDEIGKNPYSGVTINFEGLAGSAAKQSFNNFLADLSARLKEQNMTLYVTVQPILPDGAYFDGFDYKTIGELADKVILMAHDYNPTSLDGYLGTQWYKNTPLTPAGQVYYSIKAAVDPQTGVADKSKLVLAMSFASIGWQISDDGKLLSPTPVRADSQTIASKLADPQTATGYSETYQNPYLTYPFSEGKNIFLWYENEQSVFEKAAIGRLLGIDGISLWRIGNIPASAGYDVTKSYQ